MGKNVRSWSKPDGITGLIGRKKVDWSIFKQGSHIPLEFIEDFEIANGGIHLSRGEKHEVILLFNNQEYHATLININRKEYSKDTLQLRWGLDLADELKTKLKKTYDDIVEIRGFKENGDSADDIETPDNDSAFIDFYQTDTNFKYRLELIQASPTIMNIHNNLQLILDKYYNARTVEAFGGNESIRQPFNELRQAIEDDNILFPAVQVNWSIGQGNWAKVPWIAFLDNRETTTTQKGIYVVYLFCEDMSGLYLTLMQGVTNVVNQDGVTRSQAREMLRNHSEALRNQFSMLANIGFNLDNNISLRTTSNLGMNYEYGTIAYKYYKNGELPGDEQLSEDLNNLLNAYNVYIDKKEDTNASSATVSGNEEQETSSINQLVKNLIENIKAKGYHFEPWQIAAYVTALRTKPFVILAGVSGTGKSKLPLLVAQATNSEYCLLPVRPDWTDSSEVLGYLDLQGNYRPGPLLEYCSEAAKNPDKYYVCIMDEMNLARVEHYFAEVLSQIENRRGDSIKGYSSGTLINQKLRTEDAVWADIKIPPNMAIVGTVNMDESTYGFSRKVLDRAFTIEFSEIDLAAWRNGLTPKTYTKKWPVNVWYPRAIRLNELDKVSDEETEIIEQIIQALIEINKILVQAQLQVAYRTRDEIVLFVLNARDIQEFFVTEHGNKVDPLDLALHMKILPRIIGGSVPIRQVVSELLGWTIKESKYQEIDVERVLEDWIKNGRPVSYDEAIYPRTAARLCLMWERISKEGFTSFWM